MTAQYRQHLPRPRDARPAGPPSWKSLSKQQRASVSISRVRRAFERHEKLVASDGAIDSSVLIPIQERDGEATILLIRRADDLANDPGHIAFPGGHVELGEDPVQAALREANEEVGLDPSLVDVIATFDPFGRRTHRERVLPVIGILTAPPELVPDRREVAAIIEVPIASLASDEASWQERWGPEGPAFVMTFFAGLPELGEDVVWGLSARILDLVLSAIFSEQVTGSE